MIDSESLIPVGKLVATHGIRGMLKLHSYSGSVESLRSCDSVILRSRDGALNRFEPKPVLPRSGKFLIGFRGVDHIDQAQPLVGSEICLRRDQLPEPEEDEYYWCDLIGLEVATVEGMALGVLEEIFEAGSSDIYVVRDAGREYLIPAIADVIHSVDLEMGRMLITPLEGLLDL